MNEIQIIGSHNSYKKAIEQNLWKLIFKQDSTLAYSLQYEHITLEEQLELGLRSLELDVYLDPEGGKYSKPLGLRFLQKFGFETEQYDSDNELTQPGLKVFHIQDFDFRSSNLLFVNCLRAIKKWSLSNKNHIPLIITINAKDSKINFDGANVPLLFNKKALESIDTEIRSVFSESELITPDFVRGEYSTLNEVVVKNGWALLEDVKGRFLFVLDEKGQKLDDYLNADKSLTGKVMFVNAEEGNHNSSILIINDPIKAETQIRDLVKKGYIIRTRADAETVEARYNNYARFEAAERSGAQIISTDYYLPSRFFDSSYQVIFDDKSYTRINPLGNTRIEKN
ncbi:MAG: phosphatidylinositol-specific phospholipase C1-like protein [Ignavibacteria bacterium]|nr:phosphatidylinositol-specific phospholipase C1-like protein [Ignavibacteria bacterium]